MKIRSVDLLPVSTRVCDMCNDPVADENRTVVKSFVLSDWGTICIECWDHRIEHHEEFGVIRPYLKSSVAQDEWTKRPLVFSAIRL